MLDSETKARRLRADLQDAQKKVAALTLQNEKLADKADRVSEAQEKINQLYVAGKIDIEGNII